MTSIFKIGGYAMHNDYTLFTRKVPSGKRVVYFYASPQDGKRVGPWSTGQTSKTSGRNYCNRLIKEGRLLPGKQGIPTFAEYAQGWWDGETCAYLKDRRKRHVLTEAYTVKSRRILNKQLVPYFGKMRLDRITAEVIEKWIDSFSDGKIKNTTINCYYGCLMTMLKWAVKKKILLSDPTTEIEKLINDRKHIEIITKEEFKALFVKDWRRVWENDLVMCTANKLAALTGMRASEVLGLRGEYVFERHIFLCAQYDQYGYRPTKTKDKHNIPLVPEMIAELNELKSVNGEGFLFSEDGGATPINYKRLLNGYYKALKNIGMTETEIKKRGLCLHAWRHFCNTELQKAGLTIQQVQAVTGHRSERMTEWYSHFDASEFAEVPKVQSELLGLGTEPPKPDKPDEKERYPAKGLHILKVPDQQTA
jgi:integrase